MATHRLDISDEHLEGRLADMAVRRGVSVDDTIMFLLERMLVGIPRKALPLRESYKPQHITIMLDQTIDRQKKIYRCNVCGNPIFNYYGGVRLEMPGLFDADQNIIDGDSTDWFGKIGVPDEVICGGRVIVQNADGTKSKIRCSTHYYRIGIGGAPA